MSPRFTLAEHLGLYAAFHRDRRNRVVHAVCTPLILWSGEVLWAQLALAVPLALVLGAALATIDLVGALVIGALLVPPAVLLEAQGGALVWPALGVHLAAWWAQTWVGHLRYEPAVKTPHGAQDSNLYFRAGWFHARGLGGTALDGLVQFCIAPLAALYDGWFALGRGHGLEAQMLAVRARVLERIAAGLVPLTPMRRRPCARGGAPAARLPRESGG